MRHVPALLIFASLIPAAQADEICFKPVHFGDIFKLSEINTGADTLLFGNEYAIENGSTARYSLPVVGSLEPVPLSKPAVKRLGLHGVNVSVHWGNHSDCTFAFDVDPQTLAPATPAVISCEGRTPGALNVSAAMSKIDCATIVSAAAAVAAGGRPLGD